MLNNPRWFANGNLLAFQWATNKQNEWWNSHIKNGHSQQCIDHWIGSRSSCWQLFMLWQKCGRCHQSYGASNCEWLVMQLTHPSFFYISIILDKNIIIYWDFFLFIFINYFMFFYYVPHPSCSTPHQYSRTKWLRRPWANKIRLRLENIVLDFISDNFMPNSIMSSLA